MKTRTVELIQKFISSHYPLKAEQLAAEYNVSQRTIRQEVLEVNTWLRQQQLPEVATIRNQGFLLDLTVSQQQKVRTQLDHLQADLLNRQERTFDLVLSIAYEKTAVFLNRKEARFQISKSTMDEDMRRLRADLLRYGIEIVSYGKQGLLYKGPERAIRTMIYDFVNQNLGRVDFYENI